MAINRYEKFRVNSYTTSLQRDGALVQYGSGDIAFFWSSAEQIPGSLNDVFRRSLLSNGTFTPEELVNIDYLTGGQETPSATLLANGRIAVAFEDTMGQDGSSLGVYARQIDFPTNTTYPKILVNVYTTNSQAEPQIVSLSDTRIAASWSTYEQFAGDSSDIMIRTFDINWGNPSSETRVNQVTADRQVQSNLVALPGKFLVTWSSDNFFSDIDIKARFYDNSGSPLGSEFPISDSPIEDGDSSAARLSNGDIAVCFTRNDNGGGIPEDIGVFGVILDAVSGIPKTSEFRISNIPQTPLTKPKYLTSKVVALDNNAFAVAWTRVTGTTQTEGDQHHIVMQYSGSGNPSVIKPEALADQTPLKQFQTSLLGLGREYMVSWSEPDGSNDGIYAKQFKAFAPVVTNENETTNEDTSITGNVLTNDYDAGGSTLKVVAVNGTPLVSGSAVITTAKGAQVTINEGGSYTYDPKTSSTFDALNVGENDNDSFTYTVENSLDQQQTVGTVSIQVDGANDAPVATVSSISINAIIGQTVERSVAGLFTDIDNDDTKLTITAALENPALANEVEVKVANSQLQVLQKPIIGPMPDTVTALVNAADPLGAQANPPVSALIQLQQQGQQGNVTTKSDGNSVTKIIKWVGYATAVVSGFTLLYKGQRVARSVWQAYSNTTNLDDNLSPVDRLFKDNISLPCFTAMISASRIASINARVDDASKPYFIVLHNFLLKPENHPYVANLKMGEATELGKLLAEEINTLLVANNQMSNEPDTFVANGDGDVAMNVLSVGGPDANGAGGVGGDDTYAYLHDGGHFQPSQQLNGNGTHYYPQPGQALNTSTSSSTGGTVTKYKKATHIGGVKYNRNKVFGAVQYEVSSEQLEEMLQRFTTQLPQIAEQARENFSKSEGYFTGLLSAVGIHFRANPGQTDEEQALLTNVRNNGDDAGHEAMDTMTTVISDAMSAAAAPDNPVLNKRRSGSPTGLSGSGESPPAVTPTTMTDSPDSGDDHHLRDEQHKQQVDVKTIALI